MNLRPSTSVAEPPFEQTNLTSFERIGRGRRRSIDGPATLSAVVCPLTPRELPAALANLAYWAEHAPPLTDAPQAGETRPTLVYSFNCDPDESFSSALINAFNENDVARNAFESVDVRFCGLPPEKDVYLRDGEVGAAPFGRKAGPNWLFYETMRSLRGEARFVFLMETDCRPIASNWIKRLQRVCALNQDAWIIGSPYCGVSPLHWSIARHINGNALYQIGDERFWDFIDNRFWPWLNQYAAGSMPDLAYDCGWETWLNRIEMEDASSYDWVLARDILHRFRLSSFIINIGGAAEQAGEYLWTKEEIVKRFPGVAIVHGPITESLDHRRGPVGLGRVFVRGETSLVDGQLVAQGDLNKAGFRRSLWIVGEPLEERHTLTISFAMQCAKNAGLALTIREPGGRIIGAEKLSGVGFGKTSTHRIIQTIPAPVPYVRLAFTFHGLDNARVSLSDLKIEISQGNQLFWRAHRIFDR